jgi:CO/xanthine dehydrogenase FAD-binding subunit
VRGDISGCELRSPRALEEALVLLSEEAGKWKPLAGGTDVMVLFSAGRLQHRRFVNIWGLKELRRIQIADHHVTMGALTTYSDVLQHPLLRTEFPLLVEAAGETGGVATQNRGTLGGNIANASPAADTPPVLLVYNAEVELTSLRGSRWLPYRGFHTGYRQTLLEPDEMVTRIRLPRMPGSPKTRFRKVGSRQAQAISKVCFAGLRSRETGEIRIAFGSMAPVPMRCFHAEAAIREGRRPEEALMEELRPITDLRSTASYRLQVAKNLLANFLNDE